MLSGDLSGTTDDEQCVAACTRAPANLANVCPVCLTSALCIGRVCTITVLANLNSRRSQGGHRSSGEEYNMDHTAAGGISASHRRRPCICCADRRPQRSQSRRSCAWTASATRRSTAAAAVRTGTASTAETATLPATRRSGMYERMTALCICLCPNRSPSRTVSFSIRRVVTYLQSTLSNANARTSGFCHFVCTTERGWSPWTGSAEALTIPRGPLSSVAGAGLAPLGSRPRGVPARQRIAM
jgi:hypothetical protein